MSTPGPTKALLGVQNITKGYGAQPVLENVSLTVHDGERIGLIGRNGSGKSTLLRIMGGLDKPEEGLVTRAQGLRVSLLSQDCPLPRERTVGETLQEAARERTALIERYHDLHMMLAEAPHDGPEHDRLMDEALTVQTAIDTAGGWDIETEIKRVNEALALAETDRVLGSLSGGELRRVDLACRLLEHPQLLLLDEPTNHIDTRSAEWIENFLQRYDGSCVLVTHDRFFLDRAVNRIVEIEFNRIYSFPGNYQRFLEYKASVEEAEARTEGNRLSFVRRELDWYRRGPKARGVKQKARMERYESAVEQGPPPRNREFLFEIPSPERLGKTILETKHLGHGFGDEVLFQNFNWIMQAGMRIGILGPNGSGKTTLLRLIMGEEQPRKGQITRGDTVRFLYADQTHTDIVPEQTILDYVSDGAKHWEIGGRRIFIPAYLSKFLFDKDSVNMPIGNLSGGERNRLIMVKRLLRGGNFLVLDEPTNDLDLYTLRVLEETLDAFEGCCLIVSHDRYFLNRVCTHLWVFEGDGTITTLPGNYDDYTLLKERKAADEKEARRTKSSNVKATPKVAASTTNPTERRKLSWAEKQELDKMEETILAAEEKVAALEAKLLEEGFYEQPFETVQATVADLEEAKKAVAAMYQRWEALSSVDQG